jgi:hypothetical protein
MISRRRRCNRKQGEAVGAIVDDVGGGGGGHGGFAGGRAVAVAMA